jgi:hypothetical protein
MDEDQPETPELQDMRKKIGDLSLKTRAIEKPKPKKKLRAPINMKKGFKCWLSFFPQKKPVAADSGNIKTVADEFISRLCKKYPICKEYIETYDDLVHYLDTFILSEVFDNLWISVCSGIADRRGRLFVDAEKFVQEFLCAKRNQANHFYFKLWDSENPKEWDKMGTFYKANIISAKKLAPQSSQSEDLSKVVAVKDNEGANWKMAKHLYRTIRRIVGLDNFPLTTRNSLSRLLYILMRRYQKTGFFYNEHNLLHAKDHAIFKHVLFGWRRGFLPLTDRSNEVYYMNKNKFDMRVVDVELFGTLDDFVNHYILKERHDIKFQAVTADETPEIWRQYFLYQIPETVTPNVLQELRSNLKYFSGTRKDDQDRILLKMYACLDRMGRIPISRPPAAIHLSRRRRQRKITEFFSKVIMDLAE